MKSVILRRLKATLNGTFGQLTYNNFCCYTCERPWLDNQNNVSCIPVGSYVCRWTKSPRLKKYTYEVTGVPKRSGIRIHSANFPEQVLGCIALGEKTGKMDGKEGVFVSVSAVRRFNDLMRKEDFTLEIKE